MINPRFMLGDRVRMRHSLARNPLDMNGTVIRVFFSAAGYYDVKFDQSPDGCILHASDIEHIIVKVKTA